MSSKRMKTETGSSSSTAGGVVDLSGDDTTHVPMSGVVFDAMHGNIMNASSSVATRRSSAAAVEHQQLEPPLRVSECYRKARDGYERSMQSHEYLDQPFTLRAKVKALAQLIRSSKACVAYTGAGLSTGAGIGDYASRDNHGSLTHSLVAQGEKSAKKARRDVLPGVSHRVMVALQKAGMLHEWVQQNHDGLPQKAGCPQHCINEIHGGWGDPSNPVITMSGHLRKDLALRFDKWSKKADLVLAMGTSLAAVGADNIVGAVSRRQQEHRAKGAVIISLQQTYFDDVCALRIFGKLDEVLGLLAEELALEVEPAGVPYAPSVTPEHLVRPDVFLIPYGVDGERNIDASPIRAQWDLSEGSSVRIVYGPAEGFRGTMKGKTNSGNYLVEFPRIVAHEDEWLLRRDLKRYPNEDPRAPRIYELGSWWVESAVLGLCDRVPFVSI